MKSSKVLKTIIIILVIVLVSLVSFIGIYVQVQNRMENKVKNYQLAMDLKGSRVISLDVKQGTETIIKDKEGNVIEEATDEEIEKNGYTEEEKVINNEEDLNIENYKKSKNIIKKRLKKLGVKDYNIRFNEENGTIYIEIPEDEETDHIVSNISETGKFEIIDSTDKTVLMDNSMIKSADILENVTDTGTVIYLNIEFNKEGKQKLKEISNTYLKADTDTEIDTNNEENITDETDTNEAEENTTNDTQTNETDETSSSTTETTEEKQITLQIDGSEMITTSFDEEISNGTIQLSMGAASSNKDTLNDTRESASTIATLLDLGNLPLEYEINENKYIQSDITEDLAIKVISVIAIIVCLALIVLIVKYKLSGLLSVISYIGLIAVYLLTIRYTNTMISLCSIAGILLIIILNYIYNIKVLNNIKNNKEEKTSKIINETYISFLIKMIPIAIISIVFTLMKLVPISSFGATLFWGIIIMLVYNIIITNMLLKIKENK